MLEGTALTARDIMTTDVAVVHPETSIQQAARLLAERHISGAPVIDDDGRLIGLLSEADMLRWHDTESARQAWWLGMLADGFELSETFLEAIRSERSRVRQVMARDVTSITESMPAGEIAALISSKGIKRVPVLRDGKIVGIVSRADLVRALAATANTARTGAAA